MLVMFDISSNLAQFVSNPLTSDETLLVLDRCDRLPIRTVERDFTVGATEPHSSSPTISGLDRLSNFMRRMKPD